MKTDFKKAAKLSELQKATKQCMSGSRYKESVAEYYLNSLTKNMKLRQDIIDGNYKISKYTEFAVHEPKYRQIKATRIRDRVWQKSMVNNGLKDELTRSFIYDNGACLKGKGTDFAIDRIICFLQKYYRKHNTNRGGVRHLDVKGYFPNTPHCVSKTLVSEKVSDKEISQNVQNIIDSFTDCRTIEEINQDPFGERGSGLGSEITQLFQLAIPDKIDHYIKERIRIEHYIRYNDDMLLIDADENKLDEACEYIKNAFAEIGLTVTDKCGRANLKNGINFMRKRFVLTTTGKVLVLPDKKKIGAERRKLKKMKNQLERGEIEYEAIQRHYQSFVGCIGRCDADSLINAMDKFYTGLFGIAPEYKRSKSNGYSKSKSANRKKRNRNSSAKSAK